jgi:cell division protein FtsX
METISRGVEREHPAGHAQLALPVTPLIEVIVVRIRSFLWILSGAVLLVLLIAVSNVANLMLARAASRQRETAIRLSIGAGRGQLIRQFMTESVLLSLGGCALGYALAVCGDLALAGAARFAAAQRNCDGLARADVHAADVAGERAAVRTRAGF